MIIHGVQASGKRDAGKCSAVQLVTDSYAVDEAKDHQSGADETEAHQGGAGVTKIYGTDRLPMTGTTVTG